MREPREGPERRLSADDLRKATSSVHDEVHAGVTVSPAAKALHQQGRDAGARGNYEEALALLTRAASLEPAWPYPVYDRAYTHLLMKNFDSALADYRRTAELAPRGFFTTLTAVDTLVREQNGECPRGLYLAYLMLEPIQDAAHKRQLVEQFVEKYPRFAPAWKEFANLTKTGADRLKAIEAGLAANPDPETKGMLLLNQALVLHDSGKSDSAVQSWRDLVANPSSTLATVELARTMLERVNTR